MLYILKRLFSAMPETGKDKRAREFRQTQQARLHAVRLQNQLLAAFDRVGGVS